jgi:parvulin-like peptidyl-prolyl isomerase
MASSGKRKTTMAKLNRESKLREKRQEKANRKDARRREAEDPSAAPVGDGNWNSPETYRP